MASPLRNEEKPGVEGGLESATSDETHFKYWESSLFNDLFIKRDMIDRQKEFWGDDSVSGFPKFYNGFRDLCEDYRKRETERDSWTETETINNWIKLILEDLGWSNNCEARQNPFLEETSFRVDNKTYRTDILIVDDPKEKQYVSKESGDKKLIEARNCVTIPVEAKYWNRLEQDRQGQKEEKTRVDNTQDDISRVCTPNEQIVKYMSILGKDWGILTDGGRWRLFNREISGVDPKRFFEFNLGALFNSILTEESEHDRQENRMAAHYFYFFFSKRTLFSEDPSSPPVIADLLSQSKKYVLQVEEDLKIRFLKAMNHACNGLAKVIEASGDSVDLKTVRNFAESYLFNIFFIKSLESRNILPISSSDYRKLSLSNIIDKLERYDPEKDNEINLRHLKRNFLKGNGQSFEYSPQGSDLHEKILFLTEMMNSGNKDRGDFGFKVVGFKETIFSDSEWRLFKKYALKNDTWVKILFELGYAESSLRNLKYQQIPYSYFTPRQLGSIYESFLEFRLEKAEADMAYLDHAWQIADLQSKKIKDKACPTVKKGQLFFTPDNKDRKATGSYYTPDYIVDHLLSQSLTPVVKGLNSSEIKALKICDPAIGSAHFLISAIGFLTDFYLGALDKEIHSDLDIPKAEAKAEILKNCIFGVDINPRAIKLAKMSLWLETARAGTVLENIDLHIVEGNSLHSTKDTLFGSVAKKGFDLIIGNPPWGGVFFDIDKIKPNIRKIVEEKNLNSFELFIRICQEWLSEDGRLGFVVPRNFLRKDQYASLREHLLLNLETVSDLGKFPGVIQEACSIVVGARNIKYLSVDTTIKDSLKQFTPSEVSEIEKSKIQGPNFVIQIGKGDSFDEIVSKLSTLKRFEDYFTFGRGIECGKLGELSECPKCGSLTSPPKKKNKKGEFRKSCDSCDTSITLETKRVTIISDHMKSGYVPIIAGPDIAPLEFTISRWIKSGVQEINYKEKLFLKKERLYIPMNNDKIVAAYDPKGKCLALKTVYVATAKEDCKLALGAVASALNSPIVNFYFEYVINNGGELTNSISTENLGSLPISAALDGSSDDEIRKSYGLTKNEYSEVIEFLKTRRRKINSAA